MFYDYIIVNNNFKFMKLKTIVQFILQVTKKYLKINFGREKGLKLNNIHYEVSILRLVIICLKQKDNYMNKFQKQVKQKKNKLQYLQTFKP